MDMIKSVQLKARVRYCALSSYSLVFVAVWMCVGLFTAAAV